MKRIHPALRVIIILLVVLGGAWLAFGGRVLAAWNRPLGPGLGLPTRTPTAGLAAAQPPTATLPAVTLPAAAGPTATGAPTALPAPATPAPLCGGPQSMLLLGIGADNRSDDYLYGLADVMRIVRVDFTIPRVTVLSIPRDLWVEIPGIEDHYGITHGKLNQAYLYGGPGMGYYDGPGGGPGLLARTIAQNFGLQVEHYGAVNMQTFVKIVDAVGGIDIYLEKGVDGSPIDEKTEDMGKFPAGQQHLTGEAALRLSRVRKRYNDLTRADNQTLVLCALKDKITTPEVLPKVPKIIAAFQDNVQTDLSPAQIGQLACLLPQLKRENLIFTGLPEDILEPSRVFDPTANHQTFVFDADFDVIRDLLDQFEAGTWPTEPDEPSCP